MAEKNKALNEMTQKQQELEKMLEEKDEEILELMSEVDVRMIERPQTDSQTQFALPNESLSPAEMVQRERDIDAYPIQPF